MLLNTLKEEVLNKYNLLQGIELNPNTIQNLGQWLRMELTYTSNAIEGNTLTRQETKLILDEGISIGGKSVNEILEVKNHKRALEKIIELSQNIEIHEFNEKDLLNIHDIILDGIDYINAGKYRNVPVRIAGSMTILPNYMKVPDLMKQLFRTINDFKSDTILEIIDLAIEIHYQLVTIHPFVDGNGRAARLIFNLILQQHNLPLTFISKEERSRYLNSLEKAQTGGSNADYIELMYKAIERSMDLYLGQNSTELTNQNENHNQLYKIGQIAKLSNEQIPTIRHWLELGLIKPFNITQGGYALFKKEAVETIKQIRYLQKEKRLSLEEIKTLIS